METESEMVDLGIHGWEGSMDSRPGVPLIKSRICQATARSQTRTSRIIIDDGTLSACFTRVCQSS